MVEKDQYGIVKQQICQAIFRRGEPPFNPILVVVSQTTKLLKKKNTMDEHST